MAKGEPQRLRAELDLEREIVRQGRASLAELGHDDRYSAILERELDKLEEAISNLERLTRKHPRWFDQL